MEVGNNFNKKYYIDRSHENFRPNPVWHDADSVSFSGRIGSEKIAKGILNSTREYLVQETAFFRQMEDLQFVKEYLKTVLAKKDDIKILDAACSSGEETWTIRMLLDDLGKNIDITGVDLGKNAIESANQRKYTISRIKNDRISTMSSYSDMFDAYNDSFVAFKNEVKNLEQQEYSRLFNEFFEETTGKAPKIPLAQRIVNFIAKTFFPVKPMELEHKFYKVKDDKKQLVKFLQGNILNLDEIAAPKSQNVILFRNALYHFTTDEGVLSLKIPKEKEEFMPVLEQIFKNINITLEKDGLYVPGSHINDHLSYIYELLEKCGFEKAFIGKDDRVLVWKKVRDAVD